MYPGLAGRVRSPSGVVGRYPVERTKKADPASVALGGLALLELSKAKKKTKIKNDNLHINKQPVSYTHLTLPTKA